MAEKKMDRRVRKTRALLTQGLMQLMNEKELKDISVRELTDLVDINRGTFYLHYNDIYDMLDKIEEELFVEFNQILDKSLKKHDEFSSPYETLKDMFLFLNEHRETAKVMIGPHGDLAYINRLKDMAKDRIRPFLEVPHSGAEDFEYRYAFLVSGYIGIVECWLNSPDPCTPEQLARQCCSMILGIFPK